MSFFKTDELKFVDYPAAWTNVYDSNFYYDDVGNRLTKTVFGGNSDTYAYDEIL